MKKYAILLIAIFSCFSLLAGNKKMNTTPTDLKPTRIAFSNHLMPSILSGKKTATIRTGKRTHYNTGKAIAYSKDGQEVAIIIEKISFTTYEWKEDGVTAEILKRENMRDTTETGFNQLYTALTKYYPDFKIGDQITITFFKLVK